MSEQLYRENGQFTEEYKFQLATHPITNNLFSLIIQYARDQNKPSVREAYDAFTTAISESAQKFHSLKTDAFEQAETVQNALLLANDMLYQFFAEIQEFQPRQENYKRINKIFWGQFFLLNGYDGAENVRRTHDIAPWEAAKHFAHEFWKFDDGKFPETIELGYLYLCENDPAMKIDLTKITNFLERFDYSKEIQLGYIYFLGLTSAVGPTDESAEDFQKRLWRLPTVDINSEFQEILGPLNDIKLHMIYDELVWRMNDEIEVRKVSLPGTTEQISEYNFKNNNIIVEKNEKIQNLYDATLVFSNAMSCFGEEFATHSYDVMMVYKAGVCAANVRSQFDHVTTLKSVQHLRRYLPLIFSAAEQLTFEHNRSWDKHLNLQVPLQVFLGGVPYELGRIIWSFQSHIFFENGAPKTGVQQFQLLDFMTACKQAALEFLEANSDNCKVIAEKQLHWKNFPHFSDSYDEREAVLTVIYDNFGYPKNLETTSEITTLKALIIFGYFCSLCETINFRNQSIIAN
jgi:hypothetical protein